MRVLIAGAGALGSVVGALLGQKNEVVLLCREKHAAQINKYGLRVTGVKNFTATLRAVKTVDEVGSENFDLVVVTVKAYDTEKMAAQLTHICNRDSIVLSLQNGIGNIEALEAVLKDVHLLGGITTMGATTVGHGVVKYAGSGTTYIAAINVGDHIHAKRVVDMFNDVGLHAELAPNYYDLAWEKCMINSCINTITTILGAKNGIIVREIAVQHIIRLICEECALVAQAMGKNVRATDLYKKVLKIARKTATNKSSMLQDVERGKRTEIDYILKPIIDVGEKNRILMPASIALYMAVKHIEASRLRTSEEDH